MTRNLASDVDPQTPILIAGPTASGKSAFALQIAEESGGVVINADALQVFEGWRILTARPGQPDLARARHALYGHMPIDATYSVGHWLRDVEQTLAQTLAQGERPIVVGGTGLYFSALTKGLADIPPTPAEIRKQANGLTLDDLLDHLSPTTKATIDIRNRARVQRAWEVLQSTGRDIGAWQAATPAPLIPIHRAKGFVLDADVDRLNQRIEQRFDQMLALGLIDEARAVLPTWDPAHQSSKAIGAPEVIAHLSGTLSLDDTRMAVILATRQYAKRQRTWFRSKMTGWQRIPVLSTG